MFTLRNAAIVAALAIASTAVAWTAGSGSGTDVTKWDAGEWKIKSTTAPASKTTYSYYIETCKPDSSATPPGVCQDTDFDAERVNGSSWADSSGNAWARCIAVDVGGGDIAYHVRYIDDPTHRPANSSWPSTIMCAIELDTDGDGVTEEYQYRIAIKPI